LRLAILSDIHEDLLRLQKVVKKIEKKGFDLCICLGDISGFSKAYYRYDKVRNASACLEILRKKCEIIIPGNHDLHAAGRIPELPEDADYEYWPHEEDLDPGYSEEEKAFLSGLPEYKILPNHQNGILLSHYASPNISGLIKGFYSSGKEFKSHFQLMQENSCTLGFTGHTHVRGFYKATSAQLRHYGYRSHILKDFPVIIGIPPVSRNNLRTGFCIFDTDNFHLQVIKLY
jgi:predicted phosphodiesterase